MANRNSPKGTAASPRSHRAQRWLRASVAGIFLVVSSIAFVSYLGTRWVERQVLTADNWVSYASNLPKNPDVSWALADVVSKQLFTNVPIEQKVAEALPPRAEFLAAPLSDQIQARTVKLVQRVEASDTFRSLWAGANRLAIERFLANARSDKAPLSARINDKFNIDISSIKPALQKRLGSQANLSPALQEKSQQALAVTADLQTKRERLWQTVRTTDFIHAILPAVFLVSVLGMLVFTVERRRSFILLSAVTIILLLVGLIAVKYGRQQVLDQVRNEPYIPAVSYIFDSLVATLRHSIFYALGFWAAVFIGCVVAGPAHWTVRLRDFLHLGNLKVSKPASWWHSVRAFVARYRVALWSGITALVLLYLAFGGSTAASNVVNSILLAVSGMFLVQLLADRRSPYVTGVTETKAGRQ